MHRTTILFALLAAPLAIGCDGGSSGPGGDVVGTWREAPTPFDDPADPIAERRTWTFRDDGTVSWETPAWEDAGTGTYETVDGRLRVTPDGEDELALDLAYYADDDGLLLGVLEPDDDGDDMVATWSGYGIYDAERVESTAFIRDDGSARLEQTTTSGTGTRVYEGTWEEREDTMQVVFEIPEDELTVTMTARLYGGLLGEMHEPL